MPTAPCGILTSMRKTRPPVPTSGRVDWSGPPAADPAADLNTLANPSLIPEAFLDTTIINGACYPYLQVQQRHYRFRILNGNQARFYNLQLYYADPAFPTEIKMVPADGATYVGPYGSVTVPNDGRCGGVPDPRLAGPMITQIGTEGGFLPTPVALNNPPKPIDFDANPASPTFWQRHRLYPAAGPGGARRYHRRLHRRAVGLHASSCTATPRRRSRAAIPGTTISPATRIIPTRA